MRVCEHVYMLYTWPPTLQNRHTNKLQVETDELLHPLGKVKNVFLKRS